MTIDEQIAEFLKADATLAELITADPSVGPEVWLCALPQGVNVGVVYQQISGPRDTTFDNAVRINARWQFTSYAKTALDARKIHNAVIAALEFLSQELVPGGDYVETDAIEDERGPMFDYDRNLNRFDADIVLSY